MMRPTAAQATTAMPIEVLVVDAGITRIVEGVCN